MATEKSLVSVKAIWYSTGELITAAIPPVEDDPLTGLSYAELKAWLADPKNKKVPVVHQDTWNYEESEDTADFFRNQLTGKVYRGGVTQKGEAVMTWVIGKADFQTRAELQGGSANDDKLASAITKKTIHKTIVALTEDDVYVVFSSAFIQARHATTDNAIGLTVTATAMEPDNDVEDIVWMAKAKVDSAVPIA